MSIPRIAINRPVTMFMLSGVIVLLGAISLLRLPVDLMPELQLPSVTIRVNYPGVGPREMEESITRPLEQAVSAVAGLEQINATSNEGSSVIRLNFAWGTNLNVAADDVRSRIDRIRARLPEEADAPIVFKFDSTAFPILFLAVEGDFNAVQLRDIAEHTLAQRLERVPGVAAVNVNGGLRRQILVELSREKTTAMGLSVDRIISLLTTENQNMPLGEVYEGDLAYMLRSPGQFTSLDEIGNLVVLTRGAVPVYMRDIAIIRDGSEDVRSIIRVNGKPGVRLSINKQSGENTVEVSAALKREVERINKEVQGVRLSVTNDSAVFIDRSIHAVREAVILGSFLVIAIIFAFLRSFRSTVIICTSIPISIFGTFALLYFGGYTLNTMTFGGLALGVGMIVDAAICVLENTERHMHMGKPPRQAAIDGSEEIWSAILASTLTHVAVFVPLFFLAGFSSVLFRQLSVVVIFSLMMSLFVAVTIVPVLCALVLTPPVPVDQRKGITGRLFTWSERLLDGMDEGYRKLLHVALAHRPTVVADQRAAVRRLDLRVHDAVLRADAADRRRRGHRRGRERRRHPHRAHGGDAGATRTAHPAGRARSADAGHGRRRPGLPGLRRAAPRPGHRDPLAALRARALERGDRHRAAQAAGRPARHRRRGRGRPGAISSSSASSAAAPTPAWRSRSAATTSTTRGGCRTTPSC